ncbi:MAG: CHAT domain-containing protein, partial [Bacteroidetes bacterium]|nr:CHAT domain-containing protein [Bacteroidota bacterium]
LALYYPALSRMYSIVKEPNKAMPLYQRSRQITISLLKNNFSILSEKEKSDYLEKTNSIFNNIAEFSLLYPQFDSLRGLCYNDELILKGLLLSSSRSMIEVVSESPDRALKNTYWLLSQQRKQISEQLSTPKDERTLNVDSIESAANNTERKLVKLSSAFADQQEQFGCKWQDVQKTLKQGEAAIEFVKIKHTILRHDSLKTDSCSYAALVLKPGDVYPQFIGLCNEESLEKILTRGDENDFDLVGRIYSSKTENTLYGLIWKPMESALAGCKKVYFAPAGQLHQISFAAIPLPSGKLLSDEYTLVQLSSTRELIRNAGKPLQSLKNAVVYGGINYETDSTLITELAVVHNMDRAEVSEAISIARGMDVASAWPYLPGTATEAENVCALLKKHNIETRQISGEKGTEESMKSLTGENAPDILHIATHGFTVPLGDKNEAYKVFENSFVQNFNPLFRTGLLFAGANRTWNGGKQIRGIEDGILTAYEAGQLDLSKTQLVVLSACETGLGTVKGSEGVYGLQRAFKAAGVKYILMTLWTIPDEQTAELMSLFYGKLASGETIRKSFAYAQNEMKKKYAAYYWAGFVLVE